MIQEICEAVLLDALKKGVARAANLIALVTEYHGGPITTEYLLTSDIAREFIERDWETKVECLSRTLVNGLTAEKAGPRRRRLGKTRTDIVLLNTPLIPLAVVEVKVGVRTFSKIERDLRKIIDLIERMKPEIAANLIGAIVFEVHLEGASRLASKMGLKQAARTLEDGLKARTVAYATTKPGFLFAITPLQRSGQGIVEADEDWDGHASRFHAIILRDKRIPPSTPS